jgi:aldose 1-epimerase
VAGPHPLRRALPSGRQFHLQHGDQEAVVTEVGASLRSYAVAGRELLDGYQSSECSRDGRGQLLLPWPNRIAGGNYRFQGGEFQLPVNEPAHGNAIHGLARWLPWIVETHSEQALRLSVTLFPQPGYEFLLRAAAEYRLVPDGLEVVVTATNLGTEPLPWGLGAHPYLTLGSPLIDELEMVMPAELWLPSNGDGIPTGPQVPVAGTAFDFRKWHRLGSLALDTTFTGLVPDASGRAAVQLRLPSSPAQLRLWMDSSQRYIQLFSGDSLSDPQDRRRALAVEPMTCAPNAFRSGDGLLVLAPGDSSTSSWGIQLT